MVSIAVALFEDAEELDFAGPWEVLRAWATQWPDDGVEVFTVAESTEPVTCAKGMRVVPDHDVGVGAGDRRPRLPRREGLAPRARRSRRAGAATEAAQGGHA